MERIERMLKGRGFGAALADAAGLAGLALTIGAAFSAGVLF